MKSSQRSDRQMLRLLRMTPERTARLHDRLIRWQLYRLATHGPGETLPNRRAEIRDMQLQIDRYGQIRED